MLFVNVSVWVPTMKFMDICIFHLDFPKWPKGVLHNLALPGRSRRIWNFITQPTFSVISNLSEKKADWGFHFTSHQSQRGWVSHGGGVVMKLAFVSESGCARLCPSLCLPLRRLIDPRASFTLRAEVPLISWLFHFFKLLLNLLQDKIWSQHPRTGGSSFNLMYSRVTGGFRKRHLVEHLPFGY